MNGLGGFADSLALRWVNARPRSRLIVGVLLVEDHGGERLVDRRLDRGAIEDGAVGDIVGDEFSTLSRDQRGLLRRCDVRTQAHWCFPADTQGPRNTVFIVVSFQSVATVCFVVCSCCRRTEVV